MVVDTDVVSYLFKKDTRAAFYNAQLIGQPAWVSFMTLAELDAWALGRNWGRARVAKLERFLKRFDVILPDRDLCRLWADITDACRRAGRPIETADAWHAAAALQFGVALLTHNRSDYEAVPRLTIISDSP